MGESANDDDNDDDDDEQEEVPTHDLPADLRMEDYDSDEENIGNLLVKDDDVDEVAEAEYMKIQKSLANDKQKNSDNEDEKSSEDDDDSSMDDDDGDTALLKPEDSREFMPTDIDGLMGMGMAKMEGYGDDNVSLGSDIEDTNLLEDDCLVLVGKAEEDFATLEVMLYAPKQGNLYVHHDIPLPAFPLSLAHGDIGPQGTAGNYCAVGTFDCGIEIWDLDVLDVLEPVMTLGGFDTGAEEELYKVNMARAAAGKKLKKKKFNHQPMKKEGSHTDAVMALSWNKVHRQVIASGSADGTVKLWDITSGSVAPASTLTHHRDKVQSVVWHPTEGSILATGSFDRTVCLIDARTASDTAANNNNNKKSQRIPADCESLAWDPFREQNLTCASEDGTLTCWDVRKFDGGEPLWSFVAHEFGVSEVSYNPNVRGLMATSSVDQTVALWDAHTIDSTSGRLKACGSKDVKVGKLYSVSFYPSKQQPWLLTAAGGSTEISVWDLTREKTIRDAFAGRRTGYGGESLVDDHENDENGASTETDFEAMMVAEEKKEPTKNSNNNSAKKSKKKKAKTKKKAHKR